MKTTDVLFESKFSKKLMTEIKVIINKWSSVHAQKLKQSIEFYKNNKSFESVGNTEEIDYYEKAKKFWAIQSTLEDIDKVFIFIEIDRNKIIEFYPNIESQESYFKYHIENYIIRIYTIIDLVGKLGNLLYETKIPDDDCNCYKFKEKIKKEKPEIAEMLEDILKYAEDRKQRRHKKLHTGNLEIEELKKVSFWEDFSDVLPDSFDFNNPVIKSMNEKRFRDMIEELRSYLNTLVLKINKFLDNSLDKI